MKLNELFEDVNDGETTFDNTANVVEWCAKHCRSLFDPRELVDNGDGSYDYNGSFTVVEKVKGLPFKLRAVHGDFYYTKCSINKNLPDIINEAGYFMGCQIKSVKDLPIKRINELYLGGNPITSLVGTQDFFSNLTADGICFTFSNIREGGLSLLLCKSLKVLIPAENKRVDGPFQIIEKYLGRPDDIFECQAELIENGFEEYAKL